uniref:TSA: Wollemia nobilis Ref_Wollemi_Transcript_11326_3396 transcribed RNA sequence n=1 Tax=Wollemia nobilis TaxID=56998 RepID=A0A0C9QSR2_9CONI
MATRLKEDEKNERIIRGLLKLPPNRRCINCNSLGPQYVCTNFWTFVCTTCSGIHREFTHRVKSVSMAKFTSQEVGNLQQGGNQKAKEIHFKDFDFQRTPLPDSSNIERLRDFIKHVYVEKRYSGERGGDRPPRGKTGDRDETYENKRPDSYRSDSRSPPYDEQYAERRYSDRAGQGARKSEYDRNRYDDRAYDERRYSYEERRSPGQYESDRTRYDRGYQDNRRYDDTYKRSPSNLESGGDRRRFEDRRFPDGPDRRKPEERSPNYQRDISPPPVRPVREILGDDVPTLRVSDFPRANGNRDVEGSTRSLPEIRDKFRGQRTASSSSMGSVEANSPTLKRVNSGSLIDFSAEPEPSSAAIQQDPFAVSSVKQPSTAIKQDPFATSSFKQPSVAAPQDPFAVSSVSHSSTAVQQGFFGVSSVSQPSTAVQQDFFGVSSDSQPSVVQQDFFGVSSVPQSSPASASDNWATFELAPQAAPGPAVAAPAALAPAPASVPSPLQSLTSAPAPQAPLPGTSAGVLDPFGKANSAQWAWAPQQVQGPPPFASGANNLPAVQQSVQPPNGMPASQPWNNLLSSTVPGTHNALPNVQPAQAAGKPPAPNLDAGSQQGPQSAVSTHNARREIPEDLFAPLYPEPAFRNMGFQGGSQLGGVSGVQFPSAGMSMQGPVLYPQSSLKSTNPFDIVGEPPASQGNLFPSMGSLQAALPDYNAPPVAAHGSAVGTFNGQWTPQAPVPYPSAAVPGLFMGQQHVSKPVQPAATPHINSFASGSFPTDDLFNNFGGSQLPPKTSLSSVGSGNPFG